MNIYGLDLETRPIKPNPQEFALQPWRVLEGAAEVHIMGTAMEQGEGAGSMQAGAIVRTSGEQGHFVCGSGAAPGEQGDFKQLIRSRLEEIIADGGVVAPAPAEERLAGEVDDVAEPRIVHLPEFIPECLQVEIPEDGDLPPGLPAEEFRLVVQG